MPFSKQFPDPPSEKVHYSRLSAVLGNPLTFPFEVSSGQESINTEENHAPEWGQTQPTVAQRISPPKSVHPSKIDCRCLQISQVI